MAWSFQGNIRGPQGPEGPEGPQGPEGPEGPQGPAGSGVTIEGTDSWTNIQALPTPDVGDMWILNADDPTAPQRPSGTPTGGAAGDGVVWDGSQWTNVGPIRGPEGPQGPAGADGEDGNGWLSGTTAPSDGLGEDGDFYLNTNTGAYYGPKTGGTWSGTGPNSIIGPQGPAGADGADGRTWFSASGPPGDGLGENGDFYLDTASDSYYGPKTGGSWTGTGPTSLVGPSGPKGDEGDPGQRGSLWYSGAGAPGSIAGETAADYYLDTTTGDVYTFV